MEIGTPRRLTISFKYNFACVFISLVSLMGRKCVDLVRRSTMTHMVSYPVDVLGSLVMKSIVIHSYFHIGSSGCTSNPDGLIMCDR